MSRFATLRRPLVCLPLGCLALCMGVLSGIARSEANHPEPVWVYFTSMCAKPGDASNCQVVKVPVRPHFPSANACAAHRDLDLAEKSNPRLLGSCLRQSEA